MKSTFSIFCLLAVLIGCGGPDYEPVYFPGTSKPDTSPDTGKNPPAKGAQCSLLLEEGKLCVKVKGDKLEEGMDPAKPLCSDVPPIPFEIQGETILLKGSDFPDIQVYIKEAPLTINGKGDTDGHSNIAKGTWTPEGDITIHDFTFYVSVFGQTGKIPHLELTTDRTKETPHLPSISGSPVGADGSTTIAASTVLGSIIEAADKYLLGASMQAVFEGKMNPPLAECLGKQGTDVESLQIAKLHLTPSGTLIEEPLPEGNILDISKGTFIADSDQKVGAQYEITAHFKATNKGKESYDILFPARIGPFAFLVEGKTKQTLKPGKALIFQVQFRPTRETVLKAGPIKEKIRIGRKLFFLRGVALDPQGKPKVDKIDDKGTPTAQNIEGVTLQPMLVPAGTVKKYFRCQTIACEGNESITQCQPCTPPNIQGCQLKAINTKNRPAEEVGSDCKALHPDSPLMMSLDLSGTDLVPMKPVKQNLAIQNNGVSDLTIERISIEEWPGSKSTGQFKLLPLTERLPVTLPPYEKGKAEMKLQVGITYQPTDLIGFDGKAAVGGESVLDKAKLVLKTGTGEMKIDLMGETKIEEVPQLTLYIATASGLKSKGPSDLFAFEELTGQTLDLAHPVTLKLAESATEGLRITEIKITGRDAELFEWLDTQEKVENRQPPSGKGKRCSIPVFDPATKRQIDEIFDLPFVSLGSQGFDLKPGAFTQENLPLIGCLNFHKEAESQTRKIYEAQLILTAVALDAQGKPKRGSDNSFKQSQLILNLAAAIDPLKGKFVSRITQTAFAILQPTAPFVAGMPAAKEVELMLKEGRGTRKELTVMIGALILDPFDEMEITDSSDKVASVPGDGVTAVFRKLDTRPSTQNYSEEALNDYATLLHDSSLPPGEEGIFYDYGTAEMPLPDPLKVNGWRIFTGALSYPGPFHKKAPIDMDQCDIVDPCSPEGLSKFSDAGVGPDGRGACAFFYPSGGRYHSPAFEPVIQGQKVDLCAERDKPQEIQAMDTGHYSVNGSLTLEDLGLRFWGPNYFLNPGGPEKFPPMDEVFHIAFTTEMLKSKKGPKDYEVVPDEKIDQSRQEHKLNLTIPQPDFISPPVCPNNTRNRRVGGREYSSWRYLAPLLFEDEEGQIPAGCPDGGFKGGSAFLKGRPIDPETGIFTLVSAAKFGPRAELSLAFKNVMIFISLNGWICDPAGDEAQFEGARCFDPEFHERDAKAQNSYLGE